MRIKDEKLLAEMRASPECQFCHRPTPTGCDPAHILSRGAGGSDIRSNVIALCWWCHRILNHNGRINAGQLWQAVAVRDGRASDEVEAEVFFVRRLSKDSDWRPGMPVQATCSSCGASIIWVKTAAGRSMPIDLVPCDDGNVVVEDGTARTLRKGVEPPANVSKFKSHFATCPNAASHRR